MQFLTFLVSRRCEKFEFVGYVWKGRTCEKVEGKEVKKVPAAVAVVVEEL